MKNALCPKFGHQRKKRDILHLIELTGVILTTEIVCEHSTDDHRRITRMVEPSARCRGSFTI